MEIGSILLAVALILAVVAFVARPLFERASQPGEATISNSLEALVAERESVLIELRDLDFEHSTGKMSDEDYTAQRYKLVTRGAEILRAIDTAPGAAQPAADDIEQLIVARRKGRVKATASSAVAACPQCGKPIEPNDKFCARCGAKVAAA
jgi:zinc-ribbon domain